MSVTPIDIARIKREVQEETAARTDAPRPQARSAGSQRWRSPPTVLRAVSILAGALVLFAALTVVFFAIMFLG